MRVGDLDGKGTVYNIAARHNTSGVVVDFAGSLILEGGERIRAFKTESRLTIHNLKSKKSAMFPNAKGGEIPFFPEAGWGTMYFTDRRIVFLRMPDYDQLFAIYYRRHSSKDHGPVVPYMVNARAMQIAQSLGMEYLEVRYPEITKCDVGLYKVGLTIAGPLGDEYVMTLPREDYHMLEPSFVGPLTDKKPRRGARYDKPLMYVSLFVACLAGLVFLGWDSLFLEVVLIGFLVAALYIFSGPSIENVKKNKWGQERASFAGMVIAFTLGTVFLAMGVIVALLRGVPLAAVLGGLFSMGLFFLALVARREWKRHSYNKRFIPFKYRCPSCGEFLQRTDIACAKCGAIVWWYRTKNTYSVRNRTGSRTRPADAWSPLP